MANKKIWLGMLVMALAFGMTVVGCEPEPEPRETYNKFYGVWVQAQPVTDVSFLDAAAQAAGMGTASYENGGKFYIKDGNQWYEENFDQLWYYFENESYKFSTGSSGTKSTSVSYTFTDTEITTGGGSKTYTFTTKQNGNLRVNILKWDDKILLKSTIVIGG
jgi:hypothetical protein